MSGRPGGGKHPKTASPIQISPTRRAHIVPQKELCFDSCELLSCQGCPRDVSSRLQQSQTESGSPSSRFLDCRSNASCDLRGTCVYVPFETLPRPQTLATHGLPPLRSPQGCPTTPCKSWMWLPDGLGGLRGRSVHKKAIPPPNSAQVLAESHIEGHRRHHTLTHTS